MLGIFISDIYVPSLPSIQVDLAASKNLLEFSVVMYFMFFALVQLIYGPLSERIGRKAVFVSGLIVSLIGCLITLTSSCIMQLLIGRAIEAIGMGAPMSISRAIIRDMVKDDVEYAKISAYMGAAVLFAPAIAPLFGAYLAHVWGWHADFIFVLFLNVICLSLTIFKLGETLEIKIARLSARHTIKNYISICKDQAFRKNVITSSFVMGCLLSYLSLSSFLFQKELGLTPVLYSWTFALGNIFITVGMLVSTYFLKYVSVNKTIQYGITFFLISALGFLVQLLLPLTVIGVLIPVMIFNLSAGIIFPTSSAASILSFTKYFGIVSGLFGCSRMLIAGMISSLSTQTQASAIDALACIFMFSAIVVIINNRH